MKLFLIDFDGTIADTFPTFVSGIQNELKRRGQAPINNIPSLRKLTARQLLEHIGIYFWEIPFIVRRVRPEIIAALPHTRVFPGMKQAIAALAKQGTVMVVTSNNTEAVTAFLAQHKIPVSAVRGDIGLFGKKRAMRNAAREAGVALTDTVYIGDEFRDLEASRAAGVRCALVSWGYNDPTALKAAKPDWLITSPQKLTKINS